MSEQKYCRECGELVPVLGQVDYSKKSEKVFYQRNWGADNPEMTFCFFYPSVHEKELCYYHDKMSEKNRRLQDGIPAYYLRESRPKKFVQEAKVIKMRRR